MNSAQIEGKWGQIKGRLRSAYGELTDDELEKAKGDREKLEGILVEKYGKTKAEVREEVNKLLDAA
ncbi:MAG: CsbD family protein [Pseudomonadota bacterium]